MSDSYPAWLLGIPEPEIPRENWDKLFEMNLDGRKIVFVSEPDEDTHRLEGTIQKVYPKLGFAVVKFHSARCTDDGGKTWVPYKRKWIIMPREELPIIRSGEPSVWLDGGAFFFRSVWFYCGWIE